MVNVIPISAGRHGGKAWRRPGSFAFASTQSVVPLVGAEFGRAALSLPMGFIEQAGSYVPVAVMSPIPGRNLFIGPEGQWLGSYVPASLRSYPFRFRNVEGADRVALCIDEDSGLVVEPDGDAEDFVDAEGNAAPATKVILDFLLAIEQSRTSTEIAVAALSNAEVIRPWQFQVTVGGKLTPATGLFRVDETAFNVLGDKTFFELRRAGALALAYLQLISMNQIAMFEQLDAVQQQLAKVHRQQRQITSLDEIFEQASADTLRFS